MSCNCSSGSSYDGGIYEGVCNADIPYPSVSHESVPSLIDNLVYALYGVIEKDVTSGKVVWNIPCDPSNIPATINNIPRNDGEGLLCYIIRALNLTGASGIVTVNGTQTLTNKTLVSPTITGSGAIAGVFTGNLTGNAGTATTLATGRTIALSGDVTGTATSFNGSANISIPVTINAGSVTPSDLSTGAPIWAESGFLNVQNAIKVFRQNNVSEGGQIELARAVDNQTGFYVDVLGATTSDNKLRIVDGTVFAERFVIDATGNVGIGTNAPTTKLDVDGTISINASTALALKGGEFKYITCESPHLAFYKKTGAYNYYFRKSDDGTNAGANMVDLMVIQDGGNVGIGTNSPSFKLDVVGSGSMTQSAIRSTDGSAARLLLANTNKAWSLTNYGTEFATNGSFNIADETAGAVRLSIDASGNIGIGTSSPAAKLDVNGNIRASYIGLVGSSYPLIELQNTSAPTDKKYLRMAQTTTGSFSIERVNDAYSIATVVLLVDASNVINANANPITNCPTTAKAWAMFKGGTANPAETLSTFNVSSISRTGVGVYSINLNVPLLPVGGSFQVTTDYAGSGALTHKAYYVNSTTILLNFFQGGTTTYIDPTMIYFVGFGN